MITSNPKVSVVMPVFNREKFVADAAKSILNQSFTDFEFIIIDDCSTDETFKILNSINDQRIKLLKLNENRGNYYARNMGMELAKGKYICVMDSDDIALPNRIQIQFDFMEKNGQIGICGSYVKVIDSDEIITAPTDYDEIKVWSLSNIMFRHPTVFIRADFLNKYNLRYNDSFRYAADYDFLVKATNFFPVTNIDKVLLEYRKLKYSPSLDNYSSKIS
jgi:glycosyltransferase involved in cell wall biosynthesis